jgi:hypothetical protein
MLLEFDNSDTDITLSNLLDDVIDDREREAATQWLLHHDLNLYNVVANLPRTVQSIDQINEALPCSSTGPRRTIGKPTIFFFFFIRSNTPFSIKAVHPIF